MHKLITLTGRSGCGKSTVEKSIIKYRTNLVRAISHTSREIRNGEKDNIDYHFTEKTKMEDMHKNNEFAEFTEYNGNYYGVSFKELMCSDILIIEPHGLKTLKDTIKDNHIPIKTISIFIDLSSASAIKRMRQRKDSEESILQRVKNDNILFSDTTSPLYDFILNGECTVEELSQQILFIYDTINFNKD